MIIALAGRRVDNPDAKQHRFPSTDTGIKILRKRIGVMLQSHRAEALVSSAACGADLLALVEAGQLGLRRRVVLPFRRDKFRTTSVTDRPGDWGFIFDEVVNEVEKRGDLLFIQPSSEDKAHVEANHAIVNEALSLGEKRRVPVVAALVWEGKSRGEDDLTEEFGVYARKMGLPIVDVLTL
jgi:hypothetical protein